MQRILVVRSSPGRVAVRIMAVVLVVAWATGCSHSAKDAGIHPAKPAPFISIAGKGVPLRGPVPWNGALSDPSNPLVLTVDADTDRLGGLCGLPDGERVTVAEDASQVVIQVSGYGDLFTGECAGVGHSPTRLRVDLSSPLGTRKLVDDSDGSSHTARDPSTFPTLTPPAGFTSVPLAWDDRDSELYRTWKSAAVDGYSSDLTLSVTPTADVDLHGAPDGPIVRSGVGIGTSTSATVWHTTDPLNDDTTVRWPVSNGRTAQLRLITHPHSPVITVDHVIDLADTATLP